MGTAKSNVFLKLGRRGKKGGKYSIVFIITLHAGTDPSVALEDLHRRPQNGGLQGASMSVLGASACPPKILGLDSHTGGSKVPAPKKCST
jgi:hypothetical protein